MLPHAPHRSLRFRRRKAPACPDHGRLRRRSFPVVLAAGLLAAVLCVAGASAAERTLSLASLAVTVWEPDVPGEGARPVIIFSHGFHGCATQSRFLEAALAEHGYLVFAPNHRDARCGGAAGRWLDPPEESFQRPMAWSAETYADRAGDIRRLIDALKQDPAWRGRIDWSRLALAGHSLGGYTVLGLAGAWPGWKLDGVKAVLGLSPYVQAYLAKGNLAGLSAPVMYQGGTLDFSITPAVRRQDGAYDRSPAPKYYVEFRRAGHLAWTELSSRAHTAITAYSIAFLDHYVKDAPADPLLTRRSGEAVVTLRYASEIGTAASSDRP